MWEPARGARDAREAHARGGGVSGSRSMVCGCAVRSTRSAAATAPPIRRRATAGAPAAAQPGIDSQPAASSGGVQSSFAVQAGGATCSPLGCPPSWAACDAPVCAPRAAWVACDGEACFDPIADARPCGSVAHASSTRVLPCANRSAAARASGARRRERVNGRSMRLKRSRARGGTPSGKASPTIMPRPTGSARRRSPPRARPPPRAGPARGRAPWARAWRPRRSA